MQTRASHGEGMGRFIAHLYLTVMLSLVFVLADEL